MKFNQLQQECFDRAAFICSRSEKSAGTVSQKLKDWGLNPEEAEPVLQKLINEQLISDERFARSFVKDKFRFNKWGRIKIAFMLKAEQVATSLIHEALEEIPEEDYLETLNKLLLDKDKTIKSDNPYERKAKLFRFAQSRGFEAELISKGIDKLLKGI